jgi:hypothetical protein
MVYPVVASSLGPFWAVAASVWGIAFVTAAEVTKDTEDVKLLGSRRVPSQSARD